MKKKAAYRMILTGMAAALFCACGRNRDPAKQNPPDRFRQSAAETPYNEPLPNDYRGTLTMWGWDDDYYRTVTEAFREIYPNVDFVYTDVAHKDLPQKYETALLSAGELPDIAWSVIDSRGEVFELDMWEPLEQEPYCFDISEIYEYLRPRMVNTKGNVCGIEQSLSPAGLAYRKDLAKQYLGTDDPGELEAMLPDWERFFEKGKEVYEKSGGSVHMCFSLSELRQFIQEQQGMPWADGGVIDVEKTFGRALELICRFRDGHISDHMAAWTPAWNAAFQEDGHIFTACATWTVQFTIQKYDKRGETKGHWGLMSAPEGNANLGGTAMGITKTCKDKRLAWEFLKFATLSTEGAKAINRIALMTTAKKPYEEAPELKSYKSPWFGEQDLGIYYMEKIVPHIKARTLTPQDGVVHDSLSMVLEVLNEDRDVGYEEAAEYLKQELKAELKDITVY